MKNILVAPSILSANFSRMGEEVKNMREIGADIIHVDVMDGMFVPNLTFGFKMISDLRPLSDLCFDVHLMIADPKRYVERFVKAGADIVTIHAEAEKDIGGTLDIIKGLGVKCGLAINPDTSVECIEPYIEKLDLILIMSVFPGFGGQKFIDGSLERLQQAASLRDKYAPNALVEVDGGINAQNAAAAAKAGADILVAGNAVFGASDKKAAVFAIKSGR